MRRSNSATASASHADALLRRAFERRYRYPAGFAGFAARVRYGTEALASTASVVLRGPGEVDLVPGDRRPTAVEWLLQELRSISRAGWGHDYEVGEGKFDKTVVTEPDSLGSLVVLHGDPHQATFRIVDDRITAMTRHHGSIVETIRIDRWHDAPAGTLLPARWVVEASDGGPAPLRTERFWDLYKELAGEMLPMLRRVETTTHEGDEVRVVAFSDWRIDGIDLEA